MYRSPRRQPHTKNLSKEGTYQIARGILISLLLTLPVPPVFGDTDLPPDETRFEYIGTTPNSTIWIETASIRETAEKRRVGILIQNTEFEAEYNGVKDVLHSIALSMSVNCTTGSYVQKGERHFSEPFGGGRLLFESVQSQTYSKILGGETAQDGSAMHHFVNTVCSTNLNRMRS